MALMLDMSKAYDCVECEFLEKIMIHLGLEEKLIYIIMLCLKSVSYSVLLNGLLMGRIKPSRGLRQTPWGRNFKSPIGSNKGHSEDNFLTSSKYGSKGDSVSTKNVDQRKTD